MSNGVYRKMVNLMNKTKAEWIEWKNIYLASMWCTCLINNSIAQGKGESTWFSLVVGTLYYCKTLLLRAALN